MAVPQDVIQKIEDGYAKLQAASDCKSLLKKHLTREVVDQCKDKRTKLGATLLDVSFWLQRMKYEYMSLGHSIWRG